jgi:hypothetical protein
MFGAILQGFRSGFSGEGSLHDTGANGYLFQGFQGNLLGQQDLFSNRTLWHNSDMLDAASPVRKKVLLPKETHWPAKDKTQTRDVSTKATSTRL